MRLNLHRLMRWLTAVLVTSLLSCSTSFWTDHLTDKKTVVVLRPGDQHAQSTIDEIYSQQNVRGDAQFNSRRFAFLLTEGTQQRSAHSTSTHRTATNRSAAQRTVTQRTVTQPAAPHDTAGYHDVTLRVGTYMAFYGVGSHPQDVRVKGLAVTDGPDDTGATQNFWRSVEGLTVERSATYACSQARTHVHNPYP